MFKSYQRPKNGIKMYWHIIMRILFLPGAIIKSNTQCLSHLDSDPLHTTKFRMRCDLHYTISIQKALLARTDFQCSEADWYESPQHDPENCIQYELQLSQKLKESCDGMRDCTYQMTYVFLDGCRQSGESGDYHPVYVHVQYQCLPSKSGYQSTFDLSPSPTPVVKSALRILAMHGSKTIKIRPPIVCFAKLFYNQTVFKKIV